MGRRQQPGRNSRKRRSEPFLEKGLTLLVLGAGLWVASIIPTSNPMLNIVAQGVKTPALFAMGLGAVLLVIHALIRSLKARGSTPTPSSGPSPAAAQASKEPSQLSSDPPVVHSTWSKDVLSAIEWRRFEAVVEALFAQAGFETRSQSHGADGGVDIWLHSKNADGPVAVVQCKHWQGKPVGVKEMREFLGVMVSKGLKRGTYATTSRYTADALEFAKANGINAQDGTGLLKLIAQRTPEQQARLLEVAYEGEYWKPTCASCGVKMVERTPKNGGAAFWGCKNYPRCKRTLVMKAG